MLSQVMQVVINYNVVIEYLNRNCPMMVEGDWDSFYQFNRCPSVIYTFLISLFQSSNYTEIDIKFNCNIYTPRPFFKVILKLNRTCTPE